MRLLQDIAERLQQRDMLQALLLIMAVQLFAIAVSWPAASRPNTSWEMIAPVRSVALMLAASSFGVFSAAHAQRRQRLETLLALLLFLPLLWPLEAATYAASYPDTPLWWTFFAPLFDLCAYFGIGLCLGLITRPVTFLWPLIPFLLLAGLIGLSSYLQQPLLNPLTSATQVSWLHLSASCLVSALTLVGCIRSKMGSNSED